jgi:hypothetical protein
VIEFGQFAAERADRAAVALDVGAVGDEDADEAADAVRGLASLQLPALQHRPRAGETRLDHRVEDLVLGPEVVVEVAARDLHRGGDVRERGVLVALAVEQPVGRLDDGLAGGFVGHGGHAARGSAGR